MANVAKMKITVLPVHHFCFLSVSHVTLALLQCHIDQRTVLWCAQHKTLKPAFHQCSATWNFHQCCFASNWTKWIESLSPVWVLVSVTVSHYRSWSDPFGNWSPPSYLFSLACCFFQNAFYGLFTSWIHGLNSKGLEDLVCQIRKTK